MQSCVIVAMSAVMGLCSVLLTGCGGSGETADDGVAERLAVDDLRSLVTMSPEPTGWPWPVNPPTRVGSPQFELDESDRSYPIQKALSDAPQDAGIVKSATSSWFDGTKKASSFANLVATSAAAESALAAELEFARTWFAEFEHQQVHDIGADGIGEQRWAVRGDTVGGKNVEISWTRANVTLAVYVSCYPCDSDVADAARRWAEVDDAARTAAD